MRLAAFGKDDFATSSGGVDAVRKIAFDPSRYRILANAESVIQSAARNTWLGAAAQEREGYAEAPGRSLPNRQLDGRVSLRGTVHPGTLALTVLVS